MPPPGPAGTQDVLAGIVERVTFHNAENGFCVIRVKARGSATLSRWWGIPRRFRRVNG